MTAKSNDLDSWIKKLDDEDMPVFASTVSDVTEAINNEDTSAVDVSRIILKDASLTSRLLKLANSFHFNPHAQKISTISRAVMVLGFDQVRALTLSLALVDSLSAGHQREKVTEEMAQSFHAAIQAQALAKKTKMDSPENIFVATLLSRLGNMAFWAFSGDQSEQLLDLLNSTQLSEQEAETKVLGFPLQDLTKSLSKSWSLGELLDEFLSGKNKDDLSVTLIGLGSDLAQSIKHGWDSDEAQHAIEKIADKLELPTQEIEEFVHHNAKNAKDIVKIYGATEVSRRIPQAVTPLVDPEDEAEAEAEEGDDIAVEVEVESNEELVKENKGDFTPLEPDINVQLSILQEMTNAIDESASITIILEMVLEGIYRGVGMDRALFAILSKDHKSLSCKYALGSDAERLCRDFAIDMSHSNNIFHQTIETKQAMHVSFDAKGLANTVTNEIVELLGAPPYLIMPTIIKGKVIGVFMADRNTSGRVIEDKDFAAFQQFCKQANMGLTFLSTQG
ncbi:MAG: hypothetical protein COB23_07745 [Methylophaga sp.]|nr:MAG: hypothetical protein COB23_07745 [Methylophaga sp.]